MKQLNHLSENTFLKLFFTFFSLCFAIGLTPISDKYGWRYGLFAAILHYYMVTTVPNLHGGFTANLVCILLLPILEHHFKTKRQRLDMRNSDAVLFE